MAVEPTDWGAPYKQLFRQTDISGYERWLAESSGNFNNPVAESMEALHEQRGVFVIIFRDTAEEGGKGVTTKAA